MVLIATSFEAIKSLAPIGARRDVPPGARRADEWSIIAERS
jgi:hypothetical protein